MRKILVGMSLLLLISGPLETVANPIWKKGIAIPVVTEGSACNSDVDKIGVTSGNVVVSCQSNTWKASSQGIPVVSSLPKHSTCYIFNWGQSGGIQARLYTDSNGFLRTDTGYIYKFDYSTGGIYYPISVAQRNYDYGISNGQLNSLLISSFQTPSNINFWGSLYNITLTANNCSTNLPAYTYNNTPQPDPGGWAAY